MSQLFELFKNDATWAIIFAVFLYLSGAWLRPLVAKIPNTNWLFRVIRLVHLVLNKVDPGGNVAKDATKLTAIAFVLFASLTQTACAASFEEARLASYCDGSINVKLESFPCGGEMQIRDYCPGRDPNDPNDLSDSNNPNNEVLGLSA